jgi:hypothetical protein
MKDLKEFKFDKSSKAPVQVHIKPEVEQQLNQLLGEQNTAQMIEFIHEATESQDPDASLMI